ncbi:MAG: hypothetical protein U0S50_08665 [Sphingopyxis sp.]|uniref:hypothetical protein n=1 Tax=Sphingopyxis sp. TaxID=1908224 RepID=UPI002ABBBE53|nr:hypothetical protein [Sphingopyxis sp.]MDZ3831874.1 hypothetical protein [Sphingopyxis sp.]
MPILLSILLSVAAPVATAQADVTIPRTDAAETSVAHADRTPKPADQARCTPYPQFQFDAKMQQAPWFGAFIKADGFRKVVASFKQAYENACASGHFVSGNDLADAPSIILRNASDSNALGLYPAEFDDAPPQPLIFLEYHYHRNGAIHTPSDAEMEEAIYCYAVGATDDERASTGRCMPD